MNDNTQHDVVTLLYEKISIPERLLGSENWDKPLTGQVFNLSAVDLSYLYFEIEKQYGIRIDQKYLRDYGFCTINQIAKAISEMKEQSS